MQDRFRDIEEQYFLLRGQLAMGRLTHEQFEAKLKELMFQDAQGRYWMIGAETSKWYMHDGVKWVEANPVTGAATTLAATNLPPPPTYVSPPTPPTIPTPSPTHTTFALSYSCPRSPRAG